MGEILQKTTIGSDTGNDAAAIAAETLLVHYSFDLSHCPAEELVSKWLQDYPARWLRLAIIEALYQGRYKSISVEQILLCWHRRSKPIYHFNLEFERLICGKLPGETLQEEEFKPTTQDAVLKVGEVAAEKAAVSSDRPTEVYTNNPPIAPMVAKSQPNLIEQTNQRSEPEITSKTEETSQTFLSPVPEENHPEKNEVVSKSIPAELIEASNVKETAPKALSQVKIKRQIIDDLLKDPWLDDEDEAAIEMMLNSESSAKTSSNSNSENFISDGKYSDLDLALPDTTSPIHEFNPIVDSSQFYDRLKALLENKLKHPQEEPRKRRSKKPR